MLVIIPLALFISFEFVYSCSDTVTTENFLGFGKDELDNRVSGGS